VIFGGFSAVFGGFWYFRRFLGGFSGFLGGFWGFQLIWINLMRFWANLD